jgi:putative ABC transport system permease protein
MTGLYAWTDFVVEGYEASGGSGRVVADEQFVTPGYFETMGITLLAGRKFDDDDGGKPAVAIVDRAFAERFWSVDDALGKWILNYPSEEPATIIGVVDSIRHYGLADSPRMIAFFPYRARPVRTFTGVLRVAGQPEDLVGGVGRVVASLDAALPIYDVTPVSKLVDRSLSRERLLAMLLNLFSLVALVLAMIGLYSVLSFAIATHSHELAVRMALGARRRDLHRLVLSRARSVTFVGIGVGVSGALVAARIFEGLIYGVGRFDALTFAAAVAVVAGVGLMASYLPARRASNVDPMIALKRY